MQFGNFDILAHLLESGRRLSTVEERQAAAYQEIKGQGDRLSRIEKRLDQIVRWVGIIMIIILLLVNLPPSISGQIISKLLKIIPMG